MSSEGISNHGIYYVEPKKIGPRTLKVNSYSFGVIDISKTRAIYYDIFSK